MYAENWVRAIFLLSFFLCWFWSSPMWFLRMDRAITQNQFHIMITFLGDSRIWNWTTLQISFEPIYFWNVSDSCNTWFRFMLIVNFNEMAIRAKQPCRQPNINNTLNEYQLRLCESSKHLTPHNQPIWLLSLMPSNRVFVVTQTKKQLISNRNQSRITAVFDCIPFFRLFLQNVGHFSFAVTAITSTSTASFN